MNIKICTLLLLLIALISSCAKDFDDINTQNDIFTVTDEGPLLAGIIESLRTGPYEQLNNNNILYPQTQLAALCKSPSVDYTMGTEEIWSNYYRTLPNFRELESRFDTMPFTKYSAMMMAVTKMLRAYKTFKMTDLFGDIPFFEAGYIFHGGTNTPRFDSQESIYKSLLLDLNWADSVFANIGSIPQLTGNAQLIDSSRYADFMRHDGLFGGDPGMWVKFGNSMRLRYAMRMADRDPVFAGDIVKDVLENDRPVLVGTDFGGPVLERAELKPAVLGYENTGKFWSFHQQPNLRMGETYWNACFNPTDSITDARIYYFFETNNSNQWNAYSSISCLESEGGSPYSDSRNYDDGFFEKGEGCRFSPVNFFFAADGMNIPELLITGTEVHFLKAEAYFRGVGVSVDEGEAFIELINAGLSFNGMWTEIFGDTKLKYGSGFNDHISFSASNLLNKWQIFVGSQPMSLELIYTQHWLDLFMQPSEAFALCRQTSLVPRTGNELHFVRFPIPPSERSFNAANYQACYGVQGDKTTTKIWWML